MSLLPTRSMPPGEPIDEVLRTFFRQEMPRPWPVAPLPPARPAPFPSSPRKARLIRSHLALAASVAILIGGSLLLLGKSQPHRGSPEPSIVLPDNGQSQNPRHLLRPENIKTSLSLEQDPMGSTTIKVDVITEDSSPRK
jgi:hypothetical protein